ncbi:MAG: hypothetical protein VW916_06205 [Flavobacteriaceae bacterium]
MTAILPMSIKIPKLGSSIFTLIQKIYLKNYGDQALPPVASFKSTHPTCLPGIGLYAKTFSPIVSDHLKEVMVSLLIVFRKLYERATTGGLF